MDLPRDFKGIWIPKDIWLHPELSWMEKCLAAEIDSLDRENEEGEEGCFASNDYLMKMFGLSKRQIQRGLEKLKKLNLIRYEKTDGRKRWLRGHSEIRVSGSMAHLGCQKCHPSNDRNVTPSPNNIHIIRNKVRKNIYMSDEATDVHDFLLSSLQNQNKKFRIKSKGAWQKNVVKLIKQYSKDEINDVIKWIFTAQHKKAEFWRGVIHSPESLYKNIDQIVTQMNNKTEEEIKKDELKEIEENRDWAQETLSEIQQIKITENCVWLVTERGEMPLGYGEKNFKDIVIKKLRSWGLI